MPAKGTTVSEESRERYRAAAHRRKSQLVRLGIVSEELYSEAVAKGLKWCNGCKVFKQPTDFTINQRRCRECSAALYSSYYEGHRENLCKDRVRSYYANHARELSNQQARGLKAYGASWEWYDGKLAEQNGQCAICGTTEFSKGNQRFHIDHDHRCCSGKKVACDKCRRGLLCSACNTSLERLETHADWIQNAAAYLRKYGSLK